MTQSNVPGGVPSAQNLQLTGGAAIVAPVSAFPGGVPPNALVVMPLSKPTEELEEKLKVGPFAVTQDQMWELLGFNGPAVQVQDGQGRPIAIGLEDLLAGLEKHWLESKEDLNRGRMYAQELMKYGRAEQAEKVLSRVVAAGGTGEDWLGLGIAQLNQEKWDKAESTLKGAANLLKENPYPSLHLAKVYKGKGDAASEDAEIRKAIQINVGCVDAWAYLFTTQKEANGEEAATKCVLELAEAAPNKASAAPFVALQGFYANEEETRPKALEFAKQAVARNASDPLALVCLTALYGQQGDLQAIISALQPHEALMARDVRLANNYFEALFRTGQIDKVTKLLNALAGSPDRQVKQFAIERSKVVAQFLQQQQQKLSGAGAPQGAPAGAPPQGGGNIIL